MVVLGLARGGVPVAWELAAALHAPVDVFLVRKLGVPQWPELAMGALASGGHVVWNESVLHDAGVDRQQIADVLARERRELERREGVYRGARAAAEVVGRIVIVVDDGVATGASMRAALAALRTAAPARLVAAVPVGPKRIGRALRPDADEVACVACPRGFAAVGQAFADFHQISDDEVRDLLATPTL